MTDQPHEVLATVKDNVANPAALGLMAFGITTVLLNLHNAGLFGMNTMILSMAVFYGGLAQVVVALQEYKKNNVFGATAFASYGLFWLSFVGMLAFPKWMGIDGPTHDRRRLVSVLPGACSRPSCSSPRCASPSRCRWSSAA